jgi:predicted DNA-binding transcriptional regulator AlpA
MAETDQQTTKFPKFLTRKQVCAIVGVTYPSLWTWVRAGHFPAGRQLGIGEGNRNKIGWVESEVLNWMQTRPLQLPKGTTKVYQPSEATAVASKTSPEPEKSGDQKRSPKKVQGGDGKSFRKVNKTRRRRA